MSAAAAQAKARFAAVYVPGFALQAALRHEPELRGQPVVLVEEKPGRIFQMTQAARQAGVRKGMTSSQGLARCPALLVRYRAPEQERMASAALGQCAACASPYLEATEAGVCTLDLKGAGGAEWKKQAESLLGQLRRQELEAKIGVAATPDLALLAAQNARPFLEIRGPEGLYDLPVAALHASPGLEETLRRLGIRRLRDFCGLSPVGLAERFGEEGLGHWRRVMGKSTRLLRLVEAAETFEEAVEFEQEIELLEPLLFMARRFLERITDRLGAAYLVVAELELEIGFAGGPAYERTFAVPSPTREVETLFRMLMTHLENFRSEQPIRSLRLAARPGRAVKEQLGLFETSLRNPNQFHQTLAQVTALLGADRVGSPVNGNTHRADAFTLGMPVFHAVKGGGGPMATARGLSLRRFRPPRRAQIFTVNGRPVSLSVRDFTASLEEASGPWAASGEWWDRAAWERKEWDVESPEGEIYRVFQEGDGNWYLEGVYD